MTSKKEDITISYTAYLHKSAMIFVKCNVCGTLHKPHSESIKESSCSNCQLIIDNNIAVKETNLHQEEIQKAMRKEVVDCKHESLPFDMNDQ